MSIDSRDRKFENIRFDGRSLDKAIRLIKDKFPRLNDSEWSRNATLSENNGETVFSDSTEGFSAFKESISAGCVGYYLTFGNLENRLTVSYHNWNSHSIAKVSVKSPDVSMIDELHDIFADKRNQIVEAPKVEKTGLPKVFIGHGRSTQWRDLKDHLTDKHKVEVVSYETGSRAGHSIRDILDDMSRSTNMALLVLTSEDELENGSAQARPNVIHETGLFQGKLGFDRAIVLLEEGCDEFSNLAGIQQLRFSKSNIRETFGDVIAVLKREFPEH